MIAEGGKEGEWAVEQPLQLQICFAERKRLRRKEGETDTSGSNRPLS